MQYAARVIDAGNAEQLCCYDTAILLRGNRSKLGGGVLRQRVARKIDREHTSGVGDIPDAHRTVESLDAAATDRQSETHTRFVRTNLRERKKHLLRSTRR